VGSGAGQADRLQIDHGGTDGNRQDIGKASDSLSEKVFREKIDQVEQTIKFCNFKISKGKELSITEIVELRKGGDPALSELIEVLLPPRSPSLSSACVRCLWTTRVSSSSGRSAIPSVPRPLCSGRRRSSDPRQTCR
jgi:hypothetical protein